jgi:hypothetical protein
VGVNLVFSLSSWFTMDETVEILKRIESQYLTILRAITPKVRGKYVSVDDAAEQLNRSAWTIRQAMMVAGKFQEKKSRDWKKKAFPDWPNAVRKAVLRCKAQWLVQDGPRAKSLWCRPVHWLRPRSGWYYLR